MITITLKNRQKLVFMNLKSLGQQDDRLDLGISRCGYVTVSRGPNDCIYKEALNKIRSIFVETKNNRFVVYRKDWR